MVGYFFLIQAETGYFPANVSIVAAVKIEKGVHVRIAGIFQIGTVQNPSPGCK